jgi:hypothetical protein
MNKYLNDFKQKKDAEDKVVTTVPFEKFHDNFIALHSNIVDEMLNEIQRKNTILHTQKFDNADYLELKNKIQNLINNEEVMVTKYLIISQKYNM